MLAPAELKKLHNKQRKARRKAERESAQAAANAPKQQHNRPCPHHDAPDDAPQLEELIPDKLARAEDPLEQAIKFLTPLQTLAANRIETHLMAFEIYCRKGKLLLMLQSIKRAMKLDPTRPELHDCLSRFHVALNSATLEPNSFVSQVLNKAAADLFGGKSPKEINDEYLNGSGKTSLAAALQGTRVYVRLETDEHLKAKAFNRLLSFDYPDVNIQNCTSVLEAYRNGDMGDVNLDLETEFMNKCRERFPYALAFRPASEPEPPRVPTPPPGTTAISDYMEQNYPVCPTMEKY